LGELVIGGGFGNAEEEYAMRRRRMYDNQII